MRIKVQQHAHLALAYRLNLIKNQIVIPFNQEDTEQGEADMYACAFSSKKTNHNSKIIPYLSNA